MAGEKHQGENASWNNPQPKPELGIHMPQLPHPSGEMSLRCMSQVIAQRSLLGLSSHLVLASFLPLIHFFAPLLVFTGITSKINYLH